MSINNMKKEDLELLSYNDIAYMLLEESGALPTAKLFRKIVDLLELSDKVYENKIGNFYTSLTTDKRFILLEDGTWDLKHNHKTSNIIIEDEEEAELEEMDDYDEDEDLEEEDIYTDDTELDDDDDVTEEYKNLVIIDEEEDFEIDE